MQNRRPEILLIDLQVFPKGTISLSLFAVAASLKEHFAVKYLDVNLKDSEWLLKNLKTEVNNAAVVGMKVSSQNFAFAKKISRGIKEVNPGVKLLWGGEFPSLLPDESGKYCDSYVTGRFEPVAAQLAKDFHDGGLTKGYHGYSPDVTALR